MQCNEMKEKSVFGMHSIRLTMLLTVCGTRYVLRCHEDTQWICTYNVLRCNFIARHKIRTTAAKTRSKMHRN